MTRTAWVVVIGASLACCPRAVAQDNPILRKLLEQKIVEELSEHHSEETAWYQEKSKNKVKYFQTNLFGREIDKKVASWTEETKTWIWLEEPAKTLSVKLTQFTLRDGRAEFALTMRAKAGFRVWGRIPRLVKGNASGTVWLDTEIAGSATLGGEGLKDGRITKLDGKLSDLQFNNDLGSPFERLITETLNDRVKSKNEKLRGSVEKAINKVKI